MKREEELITRWIDGELDAAEQVEFDKLAAADPDFPERAKAASAALGGALRSAMEADVEPPYPDFFNSQIQKRIREEVSVGGGARVSVWSWLSSPFTIGAAVAACAVIAMLLVSRGGEGTFSSGSQVVSTYAPDPMVEVLRAEFDAGAGATVILLTGLERIPDEIEIGGRDIATFEPAGPRGFGRFYTKDAQLAYILETDADGAPHFYTRSKG